jgi:hypothetical protein
MVIVILDIKTKLIKRDKKGHNILVKKTIHQEDKIITKLRSWSISVPNFIRQRLLNIQRQIGLDMVIVINLISRSSRQKKIST